MLRNFITVAIRNLVRDKMHTGINVLGLSIGMACCLLILVYVKQEMAYNRQFENGDRIFRVNRGTEENSGNWTFGERTSGPLGLAIKEQFPEAEDVVRLYRRDGWITVGRETFALTLCASELNVFDVFDLPITKGNLKSTLLDPHTVLLTERTAKTLFGDADPTGKVIQVEAYGLDGDYKVVGVLKDLPASSTLQFDLFTTNMRLEPAHLLEEWVKTGWRRIETYVLLPEAHLARRLEDKIQALLGQHMGAEIAAKNRYRLQSFESIYLYSAPEFHIPKENFGVSGIVYGNIHDVRLASLIAVFVLLIACVNFINLSTARSVKRAREVGLRKTIGASQRMIIVQFLGETILLSAIAIVFAVGLAMLVLPTFGDFVGRSLQFEMMQNPSLLILPVLLSLFVGVAAGSYPAFYMSAFQPNDMLKGGTGFRRSGDKLRKFLVIFQFSASIVLIIATMVSSEQVAYLRKKDLGFDRSQVVILPIFFQLSGREGLLFNRKYNTVKQAFLAHPHVKMVSASRFAFGGFSPQARFLAEGTGEQPWQFRVFPVEEDFISAFDINLLSGRNFTRAYTELTSGARKERGLEEVFIVNETAARQLGWENPVGKRLTWHNKPGTVIGLVEDFHFQSLKEVVEPMVMVPQFQALKFLYLKVDSPDFQETLGFLEDTWKQFLPNRPFEFRFLNDRLDRLYQEEAQLNRMFIWFSSLAIFISCMGLFGLASFMTERRVKEIGIRKVLGASAGKVVALLVQDFAKLIMIAAFVALPVAYYMMAGWLADFPYRIVLGYAPFLFGIVMAFAVALVAVGYQAISAALANPVDSLRHE